MTNFQLIVTDRVTGDKREYEWDHMPSHSQIYAAITDNSSGGLERFPDGSGLTSKMWLRRVKLIFGWELYLVKEYGPPEWPRPVVRFGKWDVCVGWKFTAFRAFLRAPKGQ